MQLHQISEVAPVVKSNSKPLFVDLSISNTAVQSLQGLDDTMARLLEAGYLPWGGYAERRSFYQVSSVFNNANATRDVHLGIDIWAPAYTAIYAPIDGVLVGVKNNDKYCDYGGTLILQHKFDSLIFYTLYGHLSLESLEIHARETIIQAGTQIASLGNKEENGGWFPHLHFQIILDLQGYQDDYPGVCSMQDAPNMLSNCPSPMPLLSFLDRNK